MVVPDLDLARLRRWAERRNAELPDRAKGQVEYRLDVSDRAVTMLECRPPWDAEDGSGEWTRQPVARFRYTHSRREWSLYWIDRNLKFHRFEPAPPTPHVDELIDIVKQDPTGIFWG